MRYAHGKNFTECQLEMLDSQLLNNLPSTTKFSNQRIKTTQDLLVTIRITCQDFLTADSGH